MTTVVTHFRLCSSCRRPLLFGARYYTCSVSTCNRGKTAYTFCSVSCFQAHVPTLRHRDAWAEEQQAPTQAAWEAQQRAEQEAALRTEAPSEPTGVVQRAATATTPKTLAAHKEPRMSNEVPKEQKDVLVVVSKVKAYIRASAGMNTSDAVTEALSELVRGACEQAVAKAKADGRKTVMARDIPGAAATASE
jgi:histone H3/H4